MKKDRNAFFESSNMNFASQNFNSNLGMPQMPMNPVPMPQMQANYSQASGQNFYVGPNGGMMPQPQYTGMNQMPMQETIQMQTPMNQNYVTNSYVGSTTIEELESKIAKLERSINRLESRLNKMETTTYSSDTYDTKVKTKCTWFKGLSFLG